MDSKKMLPWLKRAKNVVVTVEERGDTYRATVLNVSEAQGFVIITTTDMVDKQTDTGWETIIKKISTFSCYAGEIIFLGLDFTFTVHAYTFNGANKPFEAKITLTMAE
jgi:hypothetical protein